MNDNKIDILCEYLNNNVAKRHPVYNEELSNSTDFIKNGYLKMLAVIMQQSGWISNAQLEMFRRIVAGAKSDKSAEDYLRMALDIEINDYVEFSSECKELELKYRWVLDSLIITCIQERSKEQLVLIAQFCESYKITKKELEYIATMARTIIGMKVSDYVNAYEVKVETIPDKTFSDYMYLLSKGCICCNENMTIFQPSYKEDVTIQALEKIREINTPYIKIVGAIIDVDSCMLTFSDREKVILESCHFTGGNRNALHFDSCKEIIISHCVFEHFSSRTLVFNKVDLIRINGCKFMDCKLKYCNDIFNDWKIFGGVIHSDSPQEIGRLDLTNTTFDDCGGINSANYYRSAFISNIKSFVDNCTFFNCWHMHRGDEIDPENEKRTMFTAESSATNCSYNNSAKFN